ncbi:MAG: DUF5615 family PIN-like protein [Planctomycetia bacterium]|nr:DUF5615 family PIN-like protein [Planctomycetia bacterium]
MTAIRFFTDEDVYRATATALRKAGVDAISTPGAARRGESDESQLKWAHAQGRAIVTFNVAHFAGLHTTWMQQGRHHGGIILSQQRPIGDLIGRLLRLAGTLDSEAMRDRLEFLSDW